MIFLLILLILKKKSGLKTYNVNFINSNSLIAKLKKDIDVSQVGKNSDIINLNLK